MQTKVKTSCCRSLPRCADCPVVLAAQARRRAGLAGRAALVEEMLHGGSPRPLPEPVHNALLQLSAARAR